MSDTKIINLFKKKIFYLNRSLGGPANLKTIIFIKKILSNLKIKSFKSNTKIFDWRSPKVWTVKKAYIEDENKIKIIDIKDNFLHILNYSSKINKVISKKQLLKNLYFLKKIPNAIPYVTSYYNKKWGFCLKYNDLKKLKSKKYKVVIDSNLVEGKIDYAELFIKGKSKKEIIFSTYICHPNLGNDNFSSVIINTLLAKYLDKKNAYYSYRFLFIPETIGSINYIKKNFINLKKNVVAGYVLSCMGKGKKINILTKYQENLSFKILYNFLKNNKYSFNIRDWEERGSDERQYCSPNVNLPFSLITKNKFMDYKEYHTSLDNLKFIENSDLINSIKFFKNFVNYLDNQKIFVSNYSCEPFLSKHDLYSSISSSFLKKKNQDNLINIIDYCDGNKTLDEIGKKININKKDLNFLIKRLEKKNIIRRL